MTAKPFTGPEPKINNISWQKVKLPCFEEYIRDKIGKIVSEKEINKIPIIISNLIKDELNWSKNISKIREEKIFNINKSSDYSTDIILKTLNIK